MVPVGRNRVRGQAPQFGALRWRRNELASALLPTMATALAVAAAFPPPRWPGGAGRVLPAPTSAKPQLRPGASVLAVRLAPEGVGTHWHYFRWRARRVHLDFRGLPIFLRAAS